MSLKKIGKAQNALFIRYFGSPKQVRMSFSDEQKSR